MSSYFTKRLLEWNLTNVREMPWKGEKNPYFIWLSEIILQQTRVEQGLSYYQKFISHYPTVVDLANASEDRVLKDWEGLGYYSRARNLHHTAKHIANFYHGKFPSDYENILQLKGVGPYTAAAIASFAFDLPHAVVDGNVSRVLARFFGIENPIDSTQGKKQIQDLAQDLIDKKQAGTYNQAIMDFGATVCKPTNPACDSCPLMKRCFAYDKDLISVLPVKSQKTKITKRHFNYVLMLDEQALLIRKRQQADIWKGLHEFVLIEDKKLLEAKQIKQKLSALLPEMNKAKYKVHAISADCQQQLTHQKIEARFFMVQFEKLPVLTEFFSVKHKKLDNFAFPRLINFFLERDFTSFMKNLIAHGK